MRYQHYRRTLLDSLAKSTAVRLEHYSPKQGLKQIDPKFKGTGVDSRARRDSWHPHSFFYRQGGAPESVVAEGAKSKYVVNLSPDHRLYDLGTDTEGHVKASQDAAHGALNMDDVHERLKSSGYKGFFNSKHPELAHVVALYDAHPVATEHAVGGRNL